MLLASTSAFSTSLLVSAKIPAKTSGYKVFTLPLINCLFPVISLISFALTLFCFNKSKVEPVATISYPYFSVNSDSQY